MTMTTIFDSPTVGSFDFNFFPKFLDLQTESRKEPVNRISV